MGRRGRIILNLSFPVYQDQDGIITITQDSVNDTTALQAPSESVKEIGKVLPHLLHYMRDTPEKGSTYYSASWTLVMGSGV